MLSAWNDRVGRVVTFAFEVLADISRKDSRTSTDPSVQLEDLQPQLLHLLSRWDDLIEPSSGNAVPPISAKAATGSTVDSPASARTSLSWGISVERSRRFLIYLIDELFIQSPAVVATAWAKNTLEHQLLGTDEGCWRFFELAEQAKADLDDAALQVCRLCLNAGFEGVYRNQASQVRTAVAGPTKSNAARQEIIASTLLTTRLPAQLGDWRNSLFDDLPMSMPVISAGQQEQSNWNFSSLLRPFRRRFGWFWPAAGAATILFATGAAIWRTLLHRG